MHSSPWRSARRGLLQRGHARLDVLDPPGSPFHATYTFVLRSLPNGVIDVLTVIPTSKNIMTSDTENVEAGPVGSDSSGHAVA